MIFVTFLRIKFLAPKFSPPKTHHHLFALKKMVIAAAPHRISGLFFSGQGIPVKWAFLVGCISPHCCFQQGRNFFRIRSQSRFQNLNFSWTFLDVLIIKFTFSYLILSTLFDVGCTTKVGSIEPFQNLENMQVQPFAHLDP